MKYVIICLSCIFIFLAALAAEARRPQKYILAVCHKTMTFCSDKKNRRVKCNSKRVVHRFNRQMALIGVVTKYTQNHVWLDLRGPKATKKRGLKYVGRKFNIYQCRPITSRSKKTI